MYRRIEKDLTAKGYDCMVYDNSLYAEKGLFIAIISKEQHSVYRVECIDSGNDIHFVSRVNYSVNVVRCIEEQRIYFVL